MNGYTRNFREVFLSTSRKENKIKELHQEGKTVAQIALYFKRNHGRSIPGPAIRGVLFPTQDYEPTIHDVPNTVPITRAPRRETPQRTVKPKKSLPKDSYDKEESKNPDKIEINKLLAKLVKEQGLDNTKMVILESPSLLTLKELTNVGIQAHQIHIPNHTESFEPIVRKHNNTYPITLGEFLTRTEVAHGNKFGFIFADYCGTLDGSTLFSPIEDIKTIFKDNLIKPGGLLAVTISKRNSKKPNKYINNDVSRLNHIVTERAYKNGYIAVDLGHGRDYNGKMHFVVYQIFNR